jgi:hypothetical protein
MAFTERLHPRAADGKFAHAAGAAAASAHVSTRRRDGTAVTESVPMGRNAFSGRRAVLARAVDFGETGPDRKTVVRHHRIPAGTEVTINRLNGNGTLEIRVPGTRITQQVFHGTLREPDGKELKLPPGHKKDGNRIVKNT